MKLDVKTPNVIKSDLFNKPVATESADHNSAIKDVIVKSLAGHVDTDMVAKSFEAGYGITPETQTDGSAVRVESIDPNVYNTTWDTNTLTLFMDVYKQPADQVVEKYVVYYDQGKTGHALFQPEIGIMSVTSPSLKQKTVNMKYIVTTKQQSFALQLSKKTADTAKLLEYSGINQIGKTIEWCMFYGDADLNNKGSKGDGLEFDGLAKLIDPANHIDARATNMNIELLNKAATLIGMNGYGTANKCYLPLSVSGDFINKYLNAQRIIMPNGNSNGMQIGMNVAQVITNNGAVALRPSKVMDIDNWLNTSAPVNPKAPLAPMVSAKLSSSVSAKFLAHDKVDEDGNVVLNKEQGTEFSYRVVAVSNEGDSRPSEIAKVSVDTSGKAVELTITLDSITTLPEYVAIYRKSQIPNDERYALIARVPAKSDGSAITFIDDGSKIPGTADVFVGEVTDETLALLEFAPLTKVPLARVSTADTFALLWYGSLRLTYPRRFVMLENVLYTSGKGEVRDSAK